MSMRKVSKDELLSIVGAGGDVSRLPSALERAVESLTLALNRERESRRKEIDEIRKMTVEVVKSLNQNQQASNEELILKMMTMIEAVSARPPIEASMIRGQDKLLEKIVIAPQEIALN